LKNKERIVPISILQKYFETIINKAIKGKIQILLFEIELYIPQRLDGDYEWRTGAERHF
jgi:hypothetical protein